MRRTWVGLAKTPLPEFHHNKEENSLFPSPTHLFIHFSFSEMKVNDVGRKLAKNKNASVDLIQCSAEGSSV